MQKSIWLENIEEEALPKLEKDIFCDILIIGGGMAGLSTALNLKDGKSTLSKESEEKYYQHKK